MEIREVIGADHRAKEQIDINRDIYIYIYTVESELKVTLVR